MINIFVADDHAVVRKGIVSLIEDENEFNFSGEAANSIELFDRLKESGADVLILDYNMPEREGIDVIKQVKEFYPNIKILVFSFTEAEAIALRVLKAGADGYINKAQSFSEIRDSIITVVKKGRYISEEVSELLTDEVLNPHHELSHKLLSEREYQVFMLLVNDKSTKEIAEELSLSTSTVGTYLQRIYSKMGMKNRVDLVKYAMKNNLIVSL